MKKRKNVFELILLDFHSNVVLVKEVKLKKNTHKNEVLKKYDDLERFWDRLLIFSFLCPILLRITLGIVWIYWLVGFL